MSGGFPIIGVGLVHGVEMTYRVDWAEADLAYLADPSDGFVEYEFASSRSSGFISTLDVLEHAADLVAEIDMEGV